MHDVIVIGAGPGGATSARRCAQTGLRTLLLDKDIFPRSKPCGGAVSEQALGQLDFSLPPSIIERECFGVRVRYKQHAIEAVKDRRIAVLVSREKFDRYLAEQAVQAGARFLSGERVTGLSITKDRVEVTTDKGAYEARYVVGADGANSLAARQVRGTFSRDEILAALVSRAPVKNEEIDARLDNTLEMHFGAAPMGYGWVFPHDGYYSVGIMGGAARFKEPQKVLSEFARSVGLDAELRQGHTIPMGGIRREIMGKRILLVGDAAGFADPFHGEGIGHAIHSGRLAAEALAARIRNDDADAFMQYEEACDRLVRRNLAVALSMARMLDAYPGLFLSIFFSNPKALDQYLDIPAGRSDYCRFRRWLLLRLPGYALRWLVTSLVPIRFALRPGKGVSCLHENRPDQGRGEADAAAPVCDGPVPRSPDAGGPDPSGGDHRGE